MLVNLHTPSAPAQTKNAPMGNRRCRPFYGASRRRFDGFRVAVVALDLILQFRLGFSSLPKCSDFDGQNFAQLFAPSRTPLDFFGTLNPQLFGLQTSGLTI